LVDERDGCAQVARGARCGVAAASGADDDQIETLLWNGYLRAVEPACFGAGSMQATGTGSAERTRP
jgi:hypothetical protein